MGKKGVCLVNDENKPESRKEPSLFKSFGMLFWLFFIVVVSASLQHELEAEGYGSISGLCLFGSYFSGLLLMKVFHIDL